MNDDPNFKPEVLRIFSVNDENERQIDLSRISPLEFFKNDIIRFRLTGRMPPEPDYRIVNFIGSVLHDITADKIDFSECDFKDTLVKGALFSNCTFDGGAFATTFFFNTVFRRCTFYNVAVHNCDFQKVEFAECDLTNLLMKSSRISESSFNACKTSNKICEMSTFFDVPFRNTSIQTETITNNFGLRSMDLHDSPVRSGRVREKYHFMDISELASLFNSPKLSVLEKLSLEYFLVHDFINGSQLLDEALDLTRWTKMYANPGSFVELLDKFSE